MDTFPLNDDDIEHYLEEIPDDVGLTDIESDKEYEPVYTTNFDRIFQTQLALSGFTNENETQTQQDEEKDLEVIFPSDDQPILSPVAIVPKSPAQDHLHDLTIAQPTTSANDKPKTRRTARQIKKDGQLSEIKNENQPQPSTSSVVKGGKKTKTDKKHNEKKIKKGKKTPEIDRKWTKKDVDTHIPPYTGNLPGPVGGVFEQCKTPTDVFLKTINPAIDNIVYQTNLYAVQAGKPLNIDANELLSFLGINFYMGYNSLPSWKNYWSTSADLGSPLVQNTMSRNRFDSILTNLHVNDNNLRPQDCKDKLYKIRPLIDTMNNHFIKIYNVNREVAVDESTILFKGRSTLKQYNPMKPIKRGYKIWCLGDIKGYISQLEVYQGKAGKIQMNDDDDVSRFGTRQQVVLRLTKPYWGTSIKVYFDNFYTSLPLLEKLKLEGVLACGTIRSDRVGLPKFDNEIMNRGDFQVQTSSLGISAYKWQDNRPVHLVSNFHGSHSTVVKRTNNKGEKLNVSCPEVVKDYNQHMGGVDLADQLRQYYCVNRRSRKWWHSLFWGIIDIAFVNSYVIYNSTNTKMSLLEYRRAVAQGLMAKKQKPNAPKRRPSDPQCTNQPKRGKHDWSISHDLSLGNRGVHFAVFTDKRGRCEVCSKNKIESRPFSICNMCKVHLCINEKKNCFKTFHEF